MAERGDGLSYRVGANGDLTNADYTNYPPFSILNYANGHGEPHFITWKINDGTFPINQSIDDWSVAYTAVNNPELSMNNIGVFISNENTPDYTTDSTQHQQIAFINSGRFYQIYQNLYNIPASTLTDSYRFHAPRINDKYNWSPNAITASYSDYNDTVLYLSNINYQGFAVPYESFGVKSLFLEIYIVPVNIGSTILPSYNISLKEYSRLTPQAKADNPIGCAYVRVHRRGNINGSYTYTNHDNADFRPIMSIPFSDGHNNVLCYFSQCNLMTYSNVYFPLWGNAFYNAYVRSDQNNDYGDFFYGYDKISGKRVTDNHNGTFTYEMYMEGTDDNLEYLRKCCAAYGLFFCDDILTDDNQNLESDTLENNNQRWLHSEMHLGIIEDNGYTEGRYTSGAENALQTQFTWKDSTESTYDPDVPPTPENQYDNTTVFNSIGDSATMFKRYVLNGTNVEQLGRDLFKIVDDIAQGDPHYDDYATQINSSMLVTNPLDSIISLQRYPMAIPHGSSAVENIKLGTNTCTAIGYPMSKTAYEYAFQGKKILPRFGDSFLDYEPYTKFEMYIPFCGTVELSPRDILNRDLSARLIVDYSTGTCTGYILSDNLVIETLNGNIAINIPVSGTDNATMQANINNAVAARASVGAQAAGSIMYRLSNNAKTTSGESISYKARQLQYNIDNADYTLNHLQSPVHTIGSASPCGAWAIDLKCRLIIYYPTGEVLTQIEGLPAWDPLKLAVYGMSTGFYTAEPAQISSFTSGLVCAQNPILNSMATNSQAYPASSQELEMIRAAIADGIIL